MDYIPCIRLTPVTILIAGILIHAEAWRARRVVFPVAGGKISRRCAPRKDGFQFVSPVPPLSISEIPLDKTEKV